MTKRRSSRRGADMKWKCLPPTNHASDDFKKKFYTDNPALKRPVLTPRKDETVMDFAWRCTLEQTLWGSVKWRLPRRRRPCEVKLKGRK